MATGFGRKNIKYVKFYRSGLKNSTISLFMIFSVTTEF